MSNQLRIKQIKEPILAQGFGKGETMCVRVILVAVSLPHHHITLLYLVPFFSVPSPRLCYCNDTKQNMIRPQLKWSILHVTGMNGERPPISQGPHDQRPPNILCTLQF